jgi:hypothetical protein
MSASVRMLTARQYTDMMLVIGADHVAAAAGSDAILYLAIPVLWVLGVIAFVALKLRSR